ncbi:2-dehydro-3-deoxy-D-arabinonate dehydratase [Paenibacillus endophyticus]|uniref:2-dehydro-3-deoxy-D-arabinonate dehydratase n=1 Tax=Paenibacillus endophyticus TaxID=1294268 RepID=A0A7W5CE00_9BACL|nr:fumarylacetoacetate hydrolase family protein [Paenibacillus endophyticus]MBB3155923.1 2-dehydro-3-deoxy-D-arabinonate dehydratase [Paenibacillus endophyticus]
MRIIRYVEDGIVKIGSISDDLYLCELDVRDAMDVFDQAQKAGQSALSYIVADRAGKEIKQVNWNELEIIIPLDAPEVWAAGVTYGRSKEARNYEATNGKLDALTFYDKVYDAVRPELFMKSTAARTVGPGQDVCIRNDSNWQVPEPELGLVLSSSGEIVGYIVGNDMSSRDIEGENPLYLPQAKVWRQSCSIGPAIRIAETVDNPYLLEMTLRIYRDGQLVVEESANTSQLKRTLEELVSFLVRDNVVFNGTVLLTGTCIVPPNQFTLVEHDLIEIEIESIGKLVNSVTKA